MAEAERDFAEFYTSRFERVRRTAYALCGDWVEAEELAQHAFVRVYAQRSMFAPQAPRSGRRWPSVTRKATCTPS